MRKLQLENTTGLTSHESEIHIWNQTQTKTYMYYWEQIVTAFESDVFELWNIQGKHLTQDWKIWLWG